MDRDGSDPDVEQTPTGPAGSGRNSPDRQQTLGGKGGGDSEPASVAPAGKTCSEDPQSCFCTEL